MSKSRCDRFFKFLAVVLLSLTFLTACSLPQVSAEDRMFQDISLNFLGEYQLPKATPFENKPIGGFSSLSYEVPGYGTPKGRGIRFYALSDPTETTDPVQFYTLKFNLETPDSETPRLKDIEVESVTVLKDSENQPLSQHQFTPESIAFSPRNSVFVATENLENSNVTSLIAEYNFQTGTLKNTVPLSPFYVPKLEDSQQKQGVEPQFGFKALTVSPDGFSPDGRDPFRLFTATEHPLIQDRDAEQATKLRLLHYVVADRASFLVSESLYPLEETSQGLIDIAAGKGGLLFSLEESNPSGKIYQLFTGDSTDISRINSLKGELRKVQPIRKKLLLDLQDLGISIQHLGSMALGPRLPDGSQSLVLISEDEGEMTQFLLFSLKLV